MRTEGTGYTIAQVDRPPRPSRPETREVVELKQLKVAQPDLGSAVDLQIALVDMQRRMQLRLPLPWISADDAWLQAEEKAGRALVRFGDIPLDWTDFRLIFRQTADVLLRFDALDAADHQAIVALAREGNALEPVVENGTPRRRGAASRARKDCPPVSTTCWCSRCGHFSRAAPKCCVSGRRSRHHIRCARFVDGNPTSPSSCRMPSGI